MTREEFIKKYEDAVEIQGAWAGGAVIADYIDSKFGQSYELDICRAALGINDNERVVNDQQAQYGSILVEKSSGARMRISPINEEIVKLEKEIERLEDECDNLENTIFEMQSTNSSVVAALKATIDDFKNERQRLGVPPNNDGLLCRIADLETRLAEQAKEIERLSQPVDDGELKELHDYARFSMCRENRDWIIGLFQRERNAREAAEKKLENISKIADKAIQCCFEGQDVWAGLESIRREIAK